jgi:hypothetical protein
MPKKKVGSRFTSGHLIMVISGLIAFILALVVLSAQTAKITVYVAKNDIIAGQRLTLSQFQPTQIPSSDLNDAYVSQEEITQDKTYFAARSISKGEPLLDKSRTPEVNESDVRLQSIPIDKSLAVNGKLSRGDRIDIIFTPEEDCAERVLRNLEVVETPTGSGGGALGGSGNNYIITVAIERAGDDLTLAGVVGSGRFQVVKATGANDSSVLRDPYCENGLDESSGGA